MAQDIKVLGTLKGVSLTSKLDPNERPVHTLSLKLELTEGHAAAQDISALLKEVVQFNIEPRQPKLK